MRRLLSRIACASLVVIAVVAMPAGVASAGPSSVVKVGSGVISYLAGMGQANNLVISRTIAPPFVYVVFDDVYPIAQGSVECRRPNAADPTRVSCQTANTVLMVQTYDRNDTIVNTTTYGGLFLTGDGDDYLDSVPSISPVVGDLGEGADTFLPGWANDNMDGGGTYPTVEDIVSYAGRTGPMYVELNGDGEAYPIRTPGEVDHLAHFEGAIGGSGADEIKGDQLYYAIGGPGNDRISCSVFTYPTDLMRMWGGDGDDVLTANCAASVWMYGQAGHDVLDASYADSSYLSGGIGNDNLKGGSMSDTLSGDPGFDTLDGGTGVDAEDLCYAESGEPVLNCEAVVI